MIQYIDKILTSLKENERSAFVTIIAYSFVSYGMLLVSFDEFRQMEWYQEILLSVGLSIAVITIGFSTLPDIKGKSDFYYTLVTSIIISVIFTVIEFIHKFGFIAFPLIYIFSIFLLWLPSLIYSATNKNEVRNNKKQSDGNDSPMQPSGKIHTSKKIHQKPRRA